MPDTFTGETYNTLCNDAEGYIAKESPEQARELLQKAISLIGTRPRARSLLADTCMSMELWSEARSQLEILITLDEGNTANNFKLAQVLEELGEYQLAQDNYSVVLDDEHDHHGANVAVKRIEIRAKDSGVNLAEIFNASVEDGSGETDKDDGGKKFKDGLQVFPDVPSDELFAESEADEEDSVEKLLKNIGLSGDSTETEENDVSELLENIGVSTSPILQSEFTDSEDSSDLQEETDDIEVETKPVSTTLDEIFGTSSSIEEEVSETGSETEEPLEEHETELYPSDSDKTLEAIFTTPQSEEETEPEAEEPEEEETEPEVEEPEEEEAEPEAEEPVEEEPEPEAEEPVEEEAEPEAEEPEEEEPEPEAEEPEEGKETLTAVFKQDAELSVDPWSPESGLLTVHLKSGVAHVKHRMLSVYQKSITAEFSSEETVKLSGEGAFVLNCGSEEPLIIELRKNMVIRKDAIVFHTGTIATELLDIPENDSFYVVKESMHEKVIFKADHPMRVILLGGNNNVYNVRASSIMATDPEITFSHTAPLEGYTEITGAGKVYLIE